MIVSRRHPPQLLVTRVRMELWRATLTWLTSLSLYTHHMHNVCVYIYKCIYIYVIYIYTYT